MSEQMRTQIRGLGKAKQNAQDGIAALQIAEGGLAEITNIMQRQRELAVQAANDTLTSTERKYLDLEFQELTKEIARIAKTTDYNGKNMLNWTDDPNTSFGAIGNKYQLQSEILAEHTKISELAKGFADSTISITFTAALTALQNLADGVDNPAATGVDDLIAALQTQIDALKNNRDANVGSATSKDQQLYDALTERLNIIVNNNAHPEEDSLARLFNQMIKNDVTHAASYTLHIGPNYGTGLGGANAKYANEMTVTYISLNPGALGLSTKNIRTQNNSTEVIDHLEKVIKSVSGVRAKIGTYINRLEYSINNIASLEFNTQDAESRIRDTNFADATTQFTRNQILVQSATSMLAQANTLPQTALTLIRGG
jgi:flagellin